MWREKGGKIGNKSLRRLLGSRPSAPEMTLRRRRKKKGRKPEADTMSSFPQPPVWVLPYLPLLSLGRLLRTNTHMTSLPQPLVSVASRACRVLSRGGREDKQKAQLTLTGHGCSGANPWRHEGYMCGGRKPGQRQRQWWLCGCDTTVLYTLSPWWVDLWTDITIVSLVCSLPQLHQGLHKFLTAGRYHRRHANSNRQTCISSSGDRSVL